MEQWRKDARSEAIIVDLEALVPQDHLLRKIEKVMDARAGWRRLCAFQELRAGLRGHRIYRTISLLCTSAISASQLNRSLNGIFLLQPAAMNLSSLAGSYCAFA